MDVGSWRDCTTLVVLSHKSTGRRIVDLTWQLNECTVSCGLSWQSELRFRVAGITLSIYALKMLPNQILVVPGLYEIALVRNRRGMFVEVFVASVAIYGVGDLQLMHDFQGIRF